MTKITDGLLQNILSKLQARLEELETELVPKVTYKVLGKLDNYTNLDEVISLETCTELFEKLQLRYDDYYECMELFVEEYELAPRNSKQVSSEFNNHPTTKIIVDMLKDAGLIEPTALWRHNYNYNCYNIVKESNLRRLKDLVNYQIKHTFKPLIFQ